MPDWLTPAILTIVTASTPLVFAAVGEIVVEKSGVLNLGIEGMMIIGAIAAFAVGVSTGSATMAIIGGAVGGMLMALIFGVLTLNLLANQVATGLALTLFGLGLSALIGHAYVGKTFPGLPKLDIPVLSDIPLVGPLIFGQDFLVYFSVASVIFVGWFLNKTRWGMLVRAVGENHDAAFAIGYSVKLVRMMAVLFGGTLAGLSVSSVHPLLGREYDCRSWLDCTCVSGICILETLQGLYRSLSIWRYHNYTTAWAGHWGRYPRPHYVYVSLFGDGDCTRIDFKRCIAVASQCSCLPWQELSLF